jgi:hypothetical protein
MMVYIFFFFFLSLFSGVAYAQPLLHRLYGFLEIFLLKNLYHVSLSLNSPFSESWEECFLGYEEPSSSKHHNIGMGEQLCFCLQQG